MKPIEYIIGLLLLALPLCAPAAEKLRYQATYQGVFSMGERWVIADLELSSSKLHWPNHVPLRAEQLEVTSEKHEFIEQHFPFRIRYRELLALETPPRVLLLERFKRTDKTRHQVTWFDGPDGTVLRFRSRGKNAGRHQLPEAMRQWLGQPASGFSYHKPARHRQHKALLGRLSLLRVVRELKLATGDQYDFPVSDGKYLYHYRIRVLKKDQVTLGKRQIPAWKLKFEGFEQPSGNLAHDPIYVWLAQDSAHTPLKFEHRHPIGRFLIHLQEYPRKAG